MALYTDVGARCTFPGCNQHDFLPFGCEACGKVFCLEHRTRDSHKCTISTPNGAEVVICSSCGRPVRIGAKQSRDEAMKQHAIYGCSNSPLVPVCPTVGCGKKLTASGSILCNKCHQRVCLSHRYEDSHPCVGISAKKGNPPKPVARKCPKCGAVAPDSHPRCLKCSTPIRITEDADSGGSCKPCMIM